MVDLVGNRRYPELARERDQLFEVGRGDDRAGRVGGTCEQHAVQRRFGVRRRKVGGRQVAGSREIDLDDLDAERGEDVAVGGIAGRGDRDPVADVEHGEKGEVERRRGAGRHRDPLRRNGNAVVLVVVRGDRLAQAAQAERIGIADAAILQRPRRRFAHAGGAGSEGCPTAIEITGWPRLFRRLASASTSIAWNGSTAPRRDMDSAIVELRNWIAGVSQRGAPHKCPNAVGITSS